MSFLRDGDKRVVVDPGMVPDVSRAILQPLAGLRESPSSVTDVVLSHHHPDHTLNVGLFPRARIHDHWATYQGDSWEDHARQFFQVSSSILMTATPGHTPQDVTVLAGTDLPGRGRLIVALTHLWWSASGPPEDPLATDPEDLHRHRQNVLEVAGLVVPGHGPAFVPDHETPR